MFLLPSELKSLPAVASRKVTQPQLTRAAAATTAATAAAAAVAASLGSLLCHATGQPVINKQRIYPKGKRCKIIYNPRIFGTKIPLKVYTCMLWAGDSGGVPTDMEKHSSPIWGVDFPKGLTDCISIFHSVSRVQAADLSNSTATAY
ncbi:Hypothetical protein CINCED_3A010233 [Cinara cedri]|uniref:Uncharacterized protein n=1 Tax=Cinara cedri TaxID=506608 RepID=A0A5E4M1A6_9HEMI|nr:Hypothetical protein CINCED_3A010233 [Cinara cedri]